MLSSYFYILVSNIIYAVLLETFKKKVQTFFVARQKKRAHHLGEVYGLSDVSSLALFFCVSSKKDLENARDLVIKIRKPDKKLVAYVFYPDYQTLDLITDKSIFFFNLNDFTLFAQMRDNLLTKIENNSFDLLIGFVHKPDPFCSFLLSEIDAGFKVGYHHPDLSTIYNLTIKDDAKGFRYSEFYKQVNHYLTVLNIQTKPLD